MKRIISSVIALILCFSLIAVCFSSCDHNVTLVKDGTSSFTLVADESVSPDAILAFNGALSEYYGVELEAKDSKSTVRFTLGDTSLGLHGYKVYVSNEGSLVFSASDNEALAYALATFESTVMNKDNAALIIDRGFVLERISDNSFPISTALDLGLEINANHELIFKYGRKTIGDKEFRTAQGAATDGEYIYFIIRMSDDSNCIIVKTDIEGNEIQVSEPLDLGHGNDMTYNSKTGYLVVCHSTSKKNTANGNGNGRRISFVDKNTLEVVHTVKNLVPYSICGIDYDAVNDCYYTCAGNFRTFVFSDDYKCTTLLIVGRESESVEGITGYTYQGMGFDGKYVYFPLSGEEDNVIVVYTTNGQYVTTFHVPTTMESESIIFYGGEMYIYYNSKGATLGKMPFDVSYRGYSA